MITADALVEAGYRAHPSPVYGGHKYANRLFQKFIKAGEVKLFAINFYEYPPIAEAEIGAACVPEVEFYQSPVGDWFSVTRHDPFPTVQAAEAWFFDVYERLGCVPDIHNQ